LLHKKTSAKDIFSTRFCFISIVILNLIQNLLF